MHAATPHINQLRGLEESYGLCSQLLKALLEGLVDASVQHPNSGQAAEPFITWRAHAW